MAPNTNLSAVENGHSNGYADGHINGNSRTLGHKASSEKQVLEQMSADAGYDQDRPNAMKDGHYSEDDNPYSEMLHLSALIVY